VFVNEKVTYYAIVDDFSSTAEPAGVLRRVEHEAGERDEQFGVDLVWSQSPLLYSYERGDGDNEIYQISEDEANQIVARIRRSETGEP
jgi:hypothetical protein